MATFNSSITTWAAASLPLVLIYGLYLQRRRSRSNLPLPPGPKKLPLVGNLFDLPSTFEWETFKAWSQEFNSDIIHLDLAGTSVVVLCSFEATDALLEKRSSIYSDRSHLPMLVDLMGWDFHLAMMKYGSKWRAHRRLFGQGLSSTNSQKFRPRELAASHGLLHRLLHSPAGFRGHIKQMAGEVIAGVAYGIDVLPARDPYLSLAEQAVESGAEASIPGRFLVDVFPLLKYIPSWFPGAEFKRKAKEWRKISHALQEVPFAEVKRQVAAGTAPHSFAQECLEILNDSEPNGTYFQEDTIKGTAAAMYVAGSDTTVTVLVTLFLAMLANPEAQKRAQMEIDSVTGGTRLPDFGDEEALPYLSALVKELLRWKTVTPISLNFLPGVFRIRLLIQYPLGVPHFIGVEDEYRGYRIPANSVVIGNIWALAHDEAMYPDPHAFRPERFLLDGKPNPNVRDPPAFGFGRRICPGQYMATASIWISVASILATFNITKSVDSDGKVIEPSYECSSGFLSAPLPFGCSIQARSEQAVALIQATRDKDSG
ncbi:cytochrome P450 [Mycena metata]|uniref:Cytochrome P450 n=1 Tax=Mycena metata TaxID=1033252 RepID=A0AAD7HZ42_9AGAR|nr:cytochrome P450 [Mycena metata]